MNSPSDDAPAVSSTGLFADSPREWWIQHTSGMWLVGVGDEIGPVGIKTQNMGKSLSPRKPLWSGPAETVKKLIEANIEKLGPPIKPKSSGGSAYSANATAQTPPDSGTKKTMNQESNPEAAETAQTTSVPPVDLPRLVRWSLSRDEDGDFQWDLLRADGTSAATVWENGVWHTWDFNGVGGENSSQDTVSNAQREALLSAINQGFLPANSD